MGQSSRALSSLPSSCVPTLSRGSVLEWKDNVSNYRELLLVEVDVLSFLRHHLVHHLSPDLGLEEVRGPHVSYPEHQHQLSISLGDHSVPG